MWTKGNIVLILCIVALFLVPGRTFACHGNSEKPQVEKSCCAENEQNTSDTAAESCCKEEKSDPKKSGGQPSKSDQHDSDCNKQCNEKTCRTALQYNPIISPHEEGLSAPITIDGLQSYGLYKPPFCPDAYFSIWQPPKLA